jgi:hypothetical protein
MFKIFYAHRGKDQDKFDKLSLPLCAPGWTDLSVDNSV